MASNWLFLIFASYGVPSPSISNRMAAGHPMARYSATFVFQLKTQFCKIKFATEGTDRELLGRPVARYSAVFVFYLRKVAFVKFEFIGAPPSASIPRVSEGICACFKAPWSHLPRGCWHDRMDTKETGRTHIVY